MSKNYSFIQYSESMILPDGVYNGKYNAEPSIIRIKEGKPVWVQFIGFIKDEDVRRSCIFDPKGIMYSNVELLLPAQEIKLQTKIAGT